MLTDDVRRYVNGLNDSTPSITVEQVLTHTSGLPNLVDLKDFENLARLNHKVEELLALTREEKQHFQPGTDFKYSDTGYILLGAIIERVSGLSYGAYLESTIFRPLAMNGTYYGDDRRIIPRRARGYSFEGGSVVNASYISMSVPHAAGGLVSTVDDLMRWDIALRSGKVVRRDLLDLAWSTRRLPDGTHSGYGFGWKIVSSTSSLVVEPASRFAVTFVARPLTRVRRICAKRVRMTLSCEPAGTARQENYNDGWPRGPPDRPIPY